MMAVRLEGGTRERLPENRGSVLCPVRGGILLRDVLLVGVDPVALDFVLRVFQLNRAGADQLGELLVERLLLSRAPLLRVADRPDVLDVVRAAERCGDEAHDFAITVVAKTIRRERLARLPLRNRLDGAGVAGRADFSFADFRGLTGCVELGGKLCE